ncbi:MAG: hypothetical protein NC310_03000 [Roseburia sp.]|nr:hypothetical protein [Anaeroplasma bactoclasticum]MCM1196026.1 hypothetical protein [Roseburia sp.]MCM1557080.1 hypothetical protein [Anaeroplasma bactoclasticum]
MKKIFGMLLMCFMVLCSCSEKPFDLENSKQKVLDMGYNVLNECKTDSEIEEIEKSILSTMKFDGYETEGLDLGVTYYVRYAIYIKDDFNSIYEAVYFITFDTVDSAQFLYNYFVESRDEGSKWRIRIIDNIIVQSNNKDVMKAIGGSFK